MHVGARCDVLWFKTVQLFDNDVVLDEELTVFLVWTAPVEFPSGSDGMFVEGAKDWLFDLVGYGHIIFYGIQPPQYEVKYTNLSIGVSVFCCLGRSPA